ncbi:hemagglutinin repeat-containing protein [Stenotrophomonas mori]|uniref:hemagglutinin repeat-containing protein n=1 Tax=Stenotrophomonas mori TaxID=2871096 RepID=UPI002020ADDB|nr:hemagglutinin repeat-containing protein [Stenotrophomonas mori]
MEKSEEGGIALAAGRDVSLLSAQEQHDLSIDEQRTKKGFLKRKTTTTHDEWHESLAVGSTLSGESVRIAAGSDLTVQGSQVIGSGDVGLAAGNDLLIESAQDTFAEQHASRQTKSGLTGGFSGGVASVGYGKSSSAAQSTLEGTTQVGSGVASLDGNLTLSAGNQLTIAAPDVAAGENLTLAARDIVLEARQDTVESSASQSSKSSGFSVGATYDPAAAYRSGRDNATAGNPGSGSTIGKLTRTADGIAAGSHAALTPVVLKAGSQRSGGSQNEASSDARVSQLAAGNNLILLASDGSITSQGAQLSAEGDALLLASRDIVFDVAHNTVTSDQQRNRSGWSVDTSASLPVGMNRQQGDGSGYSDTVTGTQLSVGGNATLRTTEGDIALTASNIVAEGDVDVHAARDLSIRSGQDVVGNANRSDDKAIGTVAISDTERFSGYHTERHRDEGTQVSQVASSVGSLDGNVRLSAGGAYTQQASHVVAAGDVDITAATIDITTADDLNSGSQQDKSLKVGAFARVNSPLIELVNNVDAARQSDGRLKAMQGMAAAANAYQSASAISGMAGGAGGGSLLSAEAGVGVATSQNQSRFNERLSQGSTISGGGNVTLTSTDGDIHVTQGNLSAGNALSLDSAGDLILEAGQSQLSDQSSGHSAGAEVGVGVSVGAQTGVYAYAQANVGSHRSNSDSTTYQNTQLSGQTLTLRSKGDTTLRGATGTADTINVATGGDLTIESLQDTAHSQSKDSNVGARVQVSFGTAWNASANVSQSKASGDHAGVGQQSGLFAGDGGYHVDVGGAVNLVGGAIASTNAGNSELSAAELNFRDLRNTMDYSASTASLGAGFGGAAGEYQGTGTGMGAADRANVGGGVPMHESGSDSSTTYATLTEGDITIGGKATTAAELGINTDASKAHQQLDDLPDLQKVLADQQAMAAAAGTVVATSRQVADDLAAHAQDKMVAAANAYLDGLSPEQQAAFGTLSGPEQQDYLLSHSADYRDAYGSSLQWGIGGDYNRALQAVTTALVGSVAGQGGTQAVADALAPYAAQLIGNRFDENHGSDPNATAQLLSHALLGALLAEVNGGNAAGGALAGAGGELAANYLTQKLYGDDPNAYDENGRFDPNRLSEMDKQTISALSQAIGALAGGASDGELRQAVVGSSIAQNAVENNYLSHAERMDYLKEIQACEKGDGDACGRAANLESLSTNRNDAFRAACADSASAACATELQKAYDALDTQLAGQVEYMEWLFKSPLEMHDSRDNERALATHTGIGDLVWKIDCAQASTNCGTSGSIWLAAQGDPLTAIRHEAMRTLAEGAGKADGVFGRVGDLLSGVYQVGKDSNALVQFGKMWSDASFINDQGFGKYFDAKQAQSKAMREGMLSGLEGYIGDISGVIRGNLNGGDYWDLYDVYAHGDAEGRVGFDVLSMFVGGAEVNALAKSILAEKVIAKAFRAAEKEALESARVANNFYRDGSPLLFPQELTTSSGVIIKANPDKMTTVLGTYLDDTNSIINGQISMPKRMVYDGPAQPGSFNLLNTPDGIYKALGPDGFWERVNRPFIDSAIKRGDDIVLATRPVEKSLLRPDGSMSGFGKEYDYLVKKGYVYDFDTGKMCFGGCK